LRWGTRRCGSEEFEDGFAVARVEERDQEQGGAGDDESQVAVGGAGAPDVDDDDLGEAEHEQGKAAETVAALADGEGGEEGGEPEGDPADGGLTSGTSRLGGSDCPGDQSLLPRNVTACPLSAAANLWKLRSSAGCVTFVFRSFVAMTKHAELYSLSSTNRRQSNSYRKL